MTSIRVLYHHEAEGWWAESKDLPGWTAVGRDFSEVRDQVRSGVERFAGPDAFLIEEGAPPGIPEPGQPPSSRPRRQTE